MEDEENLDLEISDKSVKDKIEKIGYSTGSSREKILEHGLLEVDGDIDESRRRFLKVLGLSAAGTFAFSYATSPYIRDWWKSQFPAEALRNQLTYTGAATAVEADGQTLDVTEAPYNASGDGETDDRAAIQQAIEDAEAGDTVYLPEGTYRVGSHPDDPYWGAALLIDGNKEGTPFRIEGEGPNTIIQYGGEERAAVLAIVPGNADDNKLSLTVRNLVVDGKHFEDGTGSTNGIKINEGHNRGHVETPTEGHNILIEDVEIRDTTGQGLGIVGGGHRHTDYVGGSGDRTFAGVENITLRRVTVDGTWRQHGIQVSSTTKHYDDESEIGVILEDIKVLNVNMEDSNDNPYNSLNVSGSCIIDGFFVADGNGSGGKVSNDGINPILRNGTFARMNAMYANNIWYETVGGTDDSIGDEWSCTLDNIRFINSDIAALRLGGTSNISNWNIGEIEINNVDRSGEYYGVGIPGEDINIDIDRVHLCNLDYGMRTWSNGTGNVDEIVYSSVGTVADSGWTVGSQEEVEECTPLDVPDEDDVGAFTQGIERVTTEQSTQFSVEPIEELQLSGGSPENPIIYAFKTDSTEVSGENVDPTDAVMEDIVVGELSGGTDTYTVDGTIERFDAERVPEIEVDEEQITASEFKNRYAIQCTFGDVTAQAAAGNIFLGGSENGISPRIDYSSFDQYYVSPDGSFDASGTKDDPWNIDAAESKAEPGDVVNFMEGTYSFSGNIEPPSGIEGEPVIFRSENRHGAVLDTFRTFEIEDKSYIHVQGFSIDAWRWFDILESDNVVIRDNYMTGPGDTSELRVRGSRQIRIMNNRLRNGGDHNMLTIMPERGDGDWENPDGPRSEKILIEGNSIARAGHQPAGSFANRDIVFRGNVLHAMIGRNGGAFVGDVRGLSENNLYASSNWGPGSASPAAKFSIKNGIYRFNKVYRNFDRPHISSPYADWNAPVGPLRIYNNVFSRQNGEGYMLWDRGEGMYIMAKLKNNIFDSSTSADAQLVPRGINNEDTEIDVRSNLFDGNPAVYDYNNEYTLAEAENEFNSRIMDISDNTAGDARFNDAESGDFTLSASSDARDAGEPLTQTTSSGSGTQIQVEDAKYFHDGWGIKGLKGDMIQVGDTLARVTDIDYDSDEITVNNSINWDAGDPVGMPWTGSNPDIGASQSGPANPKIHVKGPERAEVGEQVDFEVEIAGEITPQEICWQFGDGTGQCGENVSHSYGEPWDYGIRVRVIDSRGDVHWGTHYLFVSDSSTRTYSDAYASSEKERLTDGS